MRYHLRFQIVPGPDDIERAHSLAAFCKRAQVAEVVLFIAAEEWNNGLLTPESWNQWKASLLRVKVILEAAGVAVSLNPWMTVLHGDHGRRMPAELPLKRMVSPSGMPSEACASFGDPEFLAYISGMYRSFAELGFRVLWIEDDFRYHNHRPLDWGGGFEDGIVQEFSRRIGQPVSRAEVVENLLRPGPPHPWRSRWMELWFDLQCEVAQAITAAVRDGSKGRSIVGLMSSSPAAHSIEGRDWQRLFTILEINGQVVHRPNFAPYEDAHPRFHSLSIQALDLQKRFRKPGYEVAPEIENMPFSNWAKSDRQTWMEMTLAGFSGADALLLDLFSFCGNDVDDDPFVKPLLIQSRPALDWISERFSSSHLHSVGVEIFWREDAASQVETKTGKNMQELAVNPFAAGHFLLRYGIPVSLSNPQPVVAIFGNAAWSVVASDLHRLLRGGLLLDGTAASILFQRGFGSQLGLKNVRMIARRESNYSMEILCAPVGDWEPGIKLSCNHQAGLALVESSGCAEVWTNISGPEGHLLGPGTLGWDLSEGGRVVILAAANPETLPACFPRQALVQRIVRYLEGEHPRLALAGGCPHFFPMQFESETEHYWVGLNASADPARPVIQGPLREISEIHLLEPLSGPVTAGEEIDSASPAETLRCPFEIPHMGFAVLKMSGPLVSHLER